MNYSWLKSQIEKELKVAKKELRQLKKYSPDLYHSIGNYRIQSTKECQRHVEGVIFGFKKVLGMLASNKVDN